MSFSNWYQADEERRQSDREAARSESAYRYWFKNLTDEQRRELDRIHREQQGPRFDAAGARW